MVAVLEAAEAGKVMHGGRRRHTERAVGMLLPTPQTDSMDPDINATMDTHDRTGSIQRPSPTSSPGGCRLPSRIRKASTASRS